LDDRSTWATLQSGVSRSVDSTRSPHPIRYVWTFAADEGADEFYDAVVGEAPCCVLSTTSCYGHADPGVPVDEDAPVDLTQPRFAAEEALRSRGATIFALAGLFGYGRSPASWLARGLVRDTGGTVNLVHRDDVVSALEAWLEEPQAARGRRLNVCTQTHRWEDLVRAYVACGLLPSEYPVPAARPGGRVISGARLRGLYTSLAARTPLDARDAQVLA
jgi:nucleoside-diphosphate-sugar epimerase